MEIKGIKPGVFEDILIELKKISNAVDFLATAQQAQRGAVPVVSAPPLTTDTGQIERCVKVNEEIQKEQEQ